MFDEEKKVQVISIYGASKNFRGLIPGSCLQILNDDDRGIFRDVFRDGAAVKL